VSGRSGTALETLALLDPAVLPSSACRSRNPVHSSARDSLFADDVSGKNSLESEGVLGVRWNGDMGIRRLWFEAPGLARPACSFCSSVQFRIAAMSWRIWNFLGSVRSKARNWRKWFVTICLLELDSCKERELPGCLPVDIVLRLRFL
jgi:hypothetical protein